MRNQKYRAHIQAADIELPVDITLERRDDIRFAITGRRVTMRLPLGSSPDLIRQKLGDLQVWVQKMLTEKPVLRDPFVGKTDRKSVV